MSFSEVWELRSFAFGLLGGPKQRAPTLSLRAGSIKASGGGGRFHHLFDMFLLWLRWKIPGVALRSREGGLGGCFEMQGNMRVWTKTPQKVNSTTELLLREQSHHGADFNSPLDNYLWIYFHFWIRILHHSNTGIHSHPKRLWRRCILFVLGANGVAVSQPEWTCESFRDLSHRLKRDNAFIKLLGENRPESECQTKMNLFSPEGWQCFVDGDERGSVFQWRRRGTTSQSNVSRTFSFGPPVKSVLTHILVPAGGTMKKKKQVNKVFLFPLLCFGHVLPSLPLFLGALLSIICHIPP